MTIQFNNNTDTVTATGGTLNAAGGSVAVAGTSSAGANLKLYEDTDNGTNFVALKAPDTLAGDVTFTLPNADGTNGQVLETNGSGVLSWTTVSSPVNPVSENLDTFSSNYTIDSGENGLSVGPMTIASGVSVTVAAGQRYIVL